MKELMPRHAENSQPFTMQKQIEMHDWAFYDVTAWKDWRAGRWMIPRNLGFVLRKHNSVYLGINGSMEHKIIKWNASNFQMPTNVVLPEFMHTFKWLSVEKDGAGYFQS